MTTKLEQGRQMDYEVFSTYLINLFKPKDSKEFDNTIARLSEKEISDLYKQFKTMEGITFAKMGAKLDYLHRLNGTCPEGYEVEKYMAGGCVKCKKKLLKNTPLMDKCGSKIKKRVSKKQEGDSINIELTKAPQTTKGLALKGIEQSQTMTGPGQLAVRRQNASLFNKCGGKMRIKKNETGSKVINTEKLSLEQKNSKPKRERTIKIEKLTPGGPGMSDSTRGAMLNSKQSKASNGKKRI